MSVPREHQRALLLGLARQAIVNDDENKVFGINFRTPPYHSTGVAHILEHSVLCDSRKFPVKKPSYHIEYSTSQSPVSDKWPLCRPRMPHDVPHVIFENDGGANRRPWFHSTGFVPLIPRSPINK